MGLRQLLLEDKREKIIVGKIGLSHEVYQWIQNNYNSKQHVFVANIIRNSISSAIPQDHLFYYLEKTTPESDVQFPPEIEYDDGTYRFINNLKYRLDEFIDILKINNKPQLDLKEIKNVSDLRNKIEEWTTIKDWIANVLPIPNLKEMEWEDAFQRANQWHEDRVESGELVSDITDVAPDTKIIHKFNDGHFWVDFHTNDCRKLGDIMGHCGSTNADTILGLFTPKGKIPASVAFNYDGEYRQAKGSQNDKPKVDKYGKYMEWLFTNEGEYQLTSYKGEYKNENDYTIEDLPEDIKDKVLEKHPELDQDSISKAERLYDEGKEDEAVEVLRGMGADLEAFGESFEEWLMMPNRNLEVALKSVMDMTNEDYILNIEYMLRNGLGEDISESDLKSLESFTKFVSSKIDELVSYAYDGEKVNLETLKDYFLNLDRQEQKEVSKNLVRMYPDDYSGLTLESTKRKLREGSTLPFHYVIDTFFENHSHDPRFIRMFKGLSINKFIESEETPDLTLIYNIIKHYFDHYIIKKYDIYYLFTYVDISDYYMNDMDDEDIILSMGSYEQFTEGVYNDYGDIIYNVDNISEKDINNWEEYSSKVMKKTDGDEETVLNMLIYFYNTGASLTPVISDKSMESFKNSLENFGLL